MSPVFSQPVAIRAINAIREVQVIMQSEAVKKNIYHEVYFPSNHILPIFHDLLAMLDQDRSLLQEAFRIAAMLFVHELQATYWGRIPPPLFLNKLYRVLSSSDLDWSSQDPVLFWIVAVALTSEMGTANQKTCLILKLKLLTVVNGITNFADILRRLRQISWNYAILKRRTEVLYSYFEENCK